MRLAPLRLLGAGAACLVVGCGSSSSQLSTAAADRMNRAVAATRAAAEAHDSKKAIAALSALSDIAMRESQEGRVSAAEERALRTAIAQARRRVELDVKSPPPQPTPPPTPAQATPVPPGAPEEKGDQEKKDAEGDTGAEENKDQGDEENKDARSGKREKAKKGNGKGGG